MVANPTTKPYEQFHNQIEINCRETGANIMKQAAIALAVITIIYAIMTVTLAFMPTLSVLNLSNNLFITCVLAICTIIVKLIAMSKYNTSYQEALNSQLDTNTLAPQDNSIITNAQYMRAIRCFYEDLIATHDSARAPVKNNAMLTPEDKCCINLPWMKLFCCNSENQTFIETLFECHVINVAVVFDQNNVQIKIILPHNSEFTTISCSTRNSISKIAYLVQYVTTWCKNNNDIISLKIENIVKNMDNNVKVDPNRFGDYYLFRANHKINGS